MKLTSSFLLLLGMFLIAFLASSEAYDFYVGGKDGWVVKPSENYPNWAGRNRFQVNDTLVFNYKKGEDSVLVVNDKDYDECNGQNPIMKLDDGLSWFKFDRSGPFYFISDIADRCRQGEKLLVVVLSVRNPPPSPYHPPSPPPSPSPKPSPNPQIPLVPSLSPSNPQTQDSHAPAPAPESSQRPHSSSPVLSVPGVALAMLVVVLGFSFLW